MQDHHGHLDEEQREKFGRARQALDLRFVLGSRRLGSNCMALLGGVGLKEAHLGLHWSLRAAPHGAGFGHPKPP